MGAPPILLTKIVRPRTRRGLKWEDEIKVEDEISGWCCKIPPPATIDYPSILSLPPDATVAQVQAAWRRLVLLHHPDKNTSGGAANGEVVDVHLINEARDVLSDPVKRKAWEKDFLRHRSTSEHGLRKKEEPHIFREVSLELFHPHFGTPTRSSSIQGDVPPEEEAEQAGDAEPTYWTYPCRCSRLFVITHQDLEDGIDTIGCEGCGEWIRVTYEAVEEDTSSAGKANAD